MIDFDKERKEIAQSFDEKMGKYLKEQAAKRTDTKARTKESEPTRRKETTPEVKDALQKAQADYVLPKFMANVTDAFVANSVPGTIATLATGQKPNLLEGNPYEEQVRSGAVGTAGQLVGQGLAYAGTGAVASPITGGIAGSVAKSKGGKIVLENLIDSVAVGMPQNYANAYAQGLTGEELERQVVRDTALEFGLGAGLGTVAQGISKLADTRKALKTVDLPTRKAPAEEVVEPVTKVAETGDLGAKTVPRQKERLTINDLADYVQTGSKRAKRVKQKTVEAGESPLLYTPEEVTDYITGSITGERANDIKGYGKVNKELADEVSLKTNGQVDIKDKYLELSSDHIKHSFDGHKLPKREGDIALNKQNYLNIPDYIDEFDDVLDVYNTSEGLVIKLGKKINGYSIITELAQESRNSLTFKNMWGVSTEKYLKEYKNKRVRYQATSNNAKGREASNLFSDVPLNARVPQKEKSVNFKDLGADTNKTPPKYKQSQSIANEKLDGEYEYETTSHAKRNEAAQQRVETDRAGEYEDLTTKEYYTDEDFATARKLFDEETSAGNTEKATRLMRKVAEQSSLKGQELEAVKHLKDNTPGGKIYKAQQEAVRGEKKIAEKNPAQHKKATGDVKKFTDIVNKSAKSADTKEEFVDNVKAEIDKLLAPKVRNVKKSALRNEIFEMVDNVKAFDTDDVEGLIDEIGTLIKSKYGIPVVSSKQANEIIGYMKRAENAVSPREKEILIARADQIIADIQKSTAREKLKSLQRISLLSNPKTLLSRNMGGNLLLASAETLKDLPATFFDKLVSLGTGQRTTTAFSGSKYAESFKGFGKGVADQFSDIKNRVDTSPSRGQYELPNKTIWDYKKSKTGVGRVANKTMNFLDKVIGKSLQFGDRPFYEAAYKSRKAELESLVKKGKSTLTPEEIDESARLFALDRTFQGDTKLARWAGQLRDTLPFGNLIVPFTQTPANIIDKLLDYSPAGLARACMQLGNVRKGTFDQKRFVDALGRTFTGGGAIALGYALYEKGLMTTDIYQEGGKDENNARTLAGEQSYSLKFGDTYISVDWADPIGSLLMIGADFGRGLGEKEELLSVLTGGVTTAVDGVFDRSFLSGLTDLFDNISNEGVLAGTLETFISQIGSQVVPNIVKSINRIYDPVKRETYDENILKKQLNVIKSGVPGLSKTLPAKINIAGEEVMQYQGRSAADRALESLLAPYNKTVTNNHEVNDYLIDLYEKTGDGGVLLDQTSKSFNYEGTQYKLKNAEELSRMQKKQGQEAVKAVKELKKSEDFRKLNNTDKAKKISNALSDAKTKAIEDYLIRSGEYTRTDIEFNKLTEGKKERFDNNKISKEAYYKYFNALAEVDENGTISQDEARKVLNNVDLTYAQKQYLWACTNKGWKTQY